MKVRCVSFAFVSAAFLAAFAMNGSSALANSSSLQLTRDAYQALQAGDADTAIASYSRAIKSKSLEPEVLANALLNRALAYQQKSLDEKAIADYTTALVLDAMLPTLRATALYNRGLSQQKTGNLPAAIQDFTSALLLNPEFSHAFYSRGNALRDSGQLLFALSDYERALRYKHPDPARVHYGVAVTYVALRRPHDARKALNEVLATNPEHAGAIQQMAKLDSAADNATSVIAEADPILTGSVAAISGGTSAKKLNLPSPVDLPDAFQSDTQSSVMPIVKRKSKKRYTDRVPTIETASYEPEVSPPAVETSDIVEVSEVPAIPEPEVMTSDTEATPVEAEEQIVTAEPAVDEPLATAEGPPASGWMVQIASAVSEDAAWSTWKKMQKSKKVLKGLNPIVVKADLGTKGIFYRVRLNGFDEQSDAKAACSKIKSGGVDCFVSKT